MIQYNEITIVFTMQLHVYESNDRFIMLMHVIGKFPISYIYDISKQVRVCTTTSGIILAGHGTQFIQVHASGLTINPKSGHQCLLLTSAIEDIVV